MAITAQIYSRANFVFILAARYQMMSGQPGIYIAHLTKHHSPLDHRQRGQADLNFHQIAFGGDDIFDILVRLRCF